MIAPACANVNRVGAWPRPEQHRCGLSVAWHCCDLSRATGAARTGDIGFDVWASDGTPTPRLPLQTPSAADAFRPRTLWMRGLLFWEAHCRPGRRNGRWLMPASMISVAKQMTDAATEPPEAPGRCKLGGR